MSVLLVGTACGPTTDAQPIREASEAPARLAAPKRLVVAINGNPTVLSQKLNSSTARTRGTPELEMLLNGALSTVDNHGQRIPLLAEQVPSTENGLWKVFPDGRMEQTWRIRDDAQWHDGTPVTSDDLVFTAQVGADPEIGAFRDVAYEYLADLQTPDARTVVATWKQPFVYADSLFSFQLALPLPRHLLEASYRDDKAHFLDQPYWSDQFVGTGPFVLREWQRDSYLALRANDHFVLGRPKIDDMEVRIILGPGPYSAAILAGEVAVTLGRGLSIEQALDVRDRWPDGHLESSPTNLLAIFPQYQRPNPAVIADATFRQALLLAIDRPSLIEAFQAGLGTVGDTMINEADSVYGEVAPSIVRYAYDPTRSTTLLAGLGYRKESDGAIRDARGERVPIELRGLANDDLNTKVTNSVVDAWVRLGLEARPLLVSPQQQQLREFSATYPGLEVVLEQAGVPRLSPLFRSTQARTAANSYTGVNRSGYNSPELDALLDRLDVTVTRSERTGYTEQIVHHLTDHAVMLGLFWVQEPMLISNRVQGAGPRSPQSTQVWNAWQWDVN